MGADPVVDSSVEDDGAKHSVDLSQVINGLRHVLGTGCLCSAIPEDLAPKGRDMIISICGIRKRRNRVLAWVCRFNAIMSEKIRLPKHRADGSRPVLSHFMIIARGGRQSCLLFRI